MFVDFRTPNMKRDFMHFDLIVSKILNIDPSLMVGVGDGYNDYPLLSVCGFKVAMENAPKELKEIADLIVPDVEHDGLVTLIDSLYNMQ